MNAHTKDLRAALPHPMQPIAPDQHGRLRFKENRLVSYLACERLNELAAVEACDEDRQQLAQLIGYSLDGWGTLSYVSDEAYAKAKALSATPQASEPAPSAPEQPSAGVEAWGVVRDGGVYSTKFNVRKASFTWAPGVTLLPEGTLIYTAPPSVPVGVLTDERIKDICAENGLGPCLGLTVGRAIEREVLVTSAPAGFVLMPVEMDDEMLRASLAVEWPAIYRDSLMYETDGPTLKAVTEARIATARKRHAAVIAAIPSPAPAPAEAVGAQRAEVPLKDHEVAAVVNALRDIAVEFGQTQQLRERIANLVVPILKRAAPGGKP